LKKFIISLFVLTFMFSLAVIAKDAFSFEPEEFPDSIIPAGIDGMGPFTTGYRDSRAEDFEVVVGEKAYHGNHSVAIYMTHPGERWLIFAKNALESGQTDALDSTFLDGLNIGDTLYYYLYVPWGAPIDSIFIFVRDLNWNQEVHSIYHASDLRFGRWNELKDGISDTTIAGFGNGAPMTIPLIQSDLQIDLIDGAEPACTLYFDCPSSKGKVPSKYVDTTGQAGISVQDPGKNPVKITKGSINCIEFTMNANAPVMVQVFDLTGRKQKEIPMGFQTAGDYSISLDLATGVYIAKITTDAVDEATGKIICVK
jgi:hypothetical protein